MISHFEKSWFNLIVHLTIEKKTTAFLCILLSSLEKESYIILFLLILFLIVTKNPSLYIYIKIQTIQHTLCVNKIRFDMNNYKGIHKKWNNWNDCLRWYIQTFTVHA